MSRFAPRFLAFLSLAAMAVFSIAQQNPPPTSPPATPAASTFDAKTKQDILEKLQGIVTSKAFVPGVDFSKWPTFLDTHRSDIDKADNENTFAREVNKVLRQFGVSHISLHTPRATEMRTTGTTSGLGFQIRKVDGGLEVTRVFPESPAGQAGIEPGDVVKEVEGKPADDPAQLRVDVGKTLSLKIAKKGGDTKELTLENKKFSTRYPETLTWIGDDAAVLRLPTFARGYDSKNIETLIQQVDAKAKYLVIDLRGNGGGLISNLNHFLSMFLPTGTPVGTFVSRTVADDYARNHTEGLTDPLVIAAWAERKFKTRQRDGVEPFSGKIAVLINRGSASASEICSAALKECHDAVLVGSKSLGAVLASTYGSLPDGFELQYPVQDYVTIKGERLEGHPREPDLVVDAKDDAVAKAIELMKKKASEHANSASAPTGHREKRAA
ncbi:MAG TPA: S41 family peptidase [Fimbriimonadaceae bacterium]|nr:S41 family peptidase [Fimbriimonadaceae bacterium]